jgi:hypothetical protein
MHVKICFQSIVILELNFIKLESLCPFAKAVQQKLWPADVHRPSDESAYQATGFRRKQPLPFGSSEPTATASSGISFKSALLPAATVTGGINQTTGNSPGIGSAVMNGTTAHITLTSAFPYHTFNTAVCSLFLRTACATLANITTDAQGNASANVGTV